MVFSVLVGDSWRLKSKNTHEKYGLYRDFPLGYVGRGTLVGVPPTIPRDYSSSLRVFSWNFAELDRAKTPCFRYVRNIESEQ